MIDLKTIIQQHQEALDITSTNHSNWADWLYSYEIEYHDKYERTKAMIDLETIIQQY